MHQCQNLAVSFSTNSVVLKSLIVFTDLFKYLPVIAAFVSVWSISSFEGTPVEPDVSRDNSAWWCPDCEPWIKIILHWMLTYQTINFSLVYLITSGCQDLCVSKHNWPISRPSHKFFICKRILIYNFWILIPIDQCQNLALSFSTNTYQWYWKA